MFKKLAVTGATAALLLTSAAGVFAYGHGHHSNNNGGPTVSNSGDIDNMSFNVANTGLNYVGGSHHSRGGSVTTGDAASVQSTSNLIDTYSDCGCTTRGGSASVKNSGDIDNLSVNVANTGLNLVHRGSLHTGDAFAQQGVVNVVSTGIGSN